MDVRGGPDDPVPVQGVGEGSDLNIFVIRTRCLRDSVGSVFERAISNSLESLILAQDERWRRA